MFILQYLFTFLLSLLENMMLDFLIFDCFCSLEVAVIKDQIQKTQYIDLHSLISFDCALMKGCNQWHNNLMTYLICNIWIMIFLNLFQYKFHKLTCRSVHSHGFIYPFLFKWVIILLVFSSDKLQSYLDKNVNIGWNPFILEITKLILFWVLDLIALSQY